jgi:hypothetical protein
VQAGDRPEERVEPGVKIHDPELTLRKAEVDSQPPPESGHRE